MYPGSPPQGLPDSERHVWRALSKLNDKWLVFHGVAWVGRRKGKTAEGEGDFILIHPAHGMLFLEVKGGSSFEIIDGEWYRLEGRRPTKIANPFEQARSTEHEVKRRIETELGIRGFRFGHAVAFPHLNQVRGLGIEASDTTTLTRTDLADIDLAVAGLIDHWELNEGFNEAQLDAIRGLLAPSLRLTATLNDELVLVRHRIEAWTQEQMLVLDGLSRNRRVLVRGGAGTGKTLLAMEKARRLAREGKNVLLVCHNAPLAGWLMSESENMET